MPNRERTNNKDNRRSALSFVLFVGKRKKTEEGVEVSIEGKHKKIRELLEMGDMGSEKAGYMAEALEEIINQKQYLENLYQTRDIQGDYVNPMGYKMLIGENGRKNAEQNVILQIFLLSLLFGGYMAYENQNQMISTLHTTKRTLISVKLTKLVWVLLLTVFCQFCLWRLKLITCREELACQLCMRQRRA